MRASRSSKSNATAAAFNSGDHWRTLVFVCTPRYISSELRRPCLLEISTVRDTKELIRISDRGGIKLMRRTCDLRSDLEGKCKTIKSSKKKRQSFLKSSEMVTRSVVRTIFISPNYDIEHVLKSFLSLLGHLKINQLHTFVKRLLKILHLKLITMHTIVIKCLKTLFYTLLSISLSGIS